LKSEEEMYETLDSLPQDAVVEAIENTAVIADKCNARIKTGRYLPHFYNVPEGSTEAELLKENTYRGATERGLATDHEFMDDVDYELEVIDDGDYSGYCLIVDDYIRSERAKDGLVGDGRGSCAGSKVAYLNDITTTNPDDYGLLFERFLSPGRTPDAVESY